MTIEAPFACYGHLPLYDELHICCISYAPVLQFNEFLEVCSWKFIESASTFIDTNSFPTLLRINIKIKEFFISNNFQYKFFIYYFYDGRNFQLSRDLIEFSLGCSKSPSQILHDWYRKLMMWFYYYLLNAELIEPWRQAGAKLM